MSYVEAIKTAILAFPFIAFLFTIPFILYNYHKYGSIHFLRVFIIYTFILYLITIYFLVILPLPTFTEAMQNKGPFINIIPLQFIRDFINESPFIWNITNTYLKTILNPSFYVPVLNIIMFIPLGLYLRYYFKCSFKKTLFLSLLVSLFFELTQLSGLYFIYPNPYRLCDIDDLILNTSGGIIGYLIMGLLEKYLPTREEIDDEARKMGEVVSGLRRITVFFLDIFIYLVITALLTIFITSDKVWLISFAIYYLILPFIYHHSTLGMRFLNVKMEYQKLDFIFNLLRCLFLIFYYFLLPCLIVVGTSLCASYFQLQHITLFLYLLVLVLIFMFYLINIILLLKNRKLFYDKMFGFHYISTINEFSLE